MTNFSYYFAGGIVLLSIITGMLLSPKGSDGATKFRRIFLSLIGFLCLSAFMTGAWYWVDNTEKKRHGPDVTHPLVKLSAQQLGGRWRAHDAFWDLDSNGVARFKFFDGRMRQGSWEIEGDILMVRLDYSNYGCYVYDFHDSTFNYRFTDEKKSYEARRLN